MLRLISTMVPITINLGVGDGDGVLGREKTLNCNSELRIALNVIILGIQAIF